MDARTEFLNLKRAWVKANETERLSIDRKIETFFASLSEDEKRAVNDAVSEDFSSMKKEVSEIRQILDVREKLASVLPIISVSYLAKNYFHKTPQWFFHRLNGNRINGKPANFTQEEISTLNSALQDISREIGSTVIET
jgi:hypothetical protein